MTSEASDLRDCKASDLPDCKDQTPSCSAAEVDNSIFSALSPLLALAQLGEGVKVCVHPESEMEVWTDASLQQSRHRLLCVGTCGASWHGAGGCQGVARQRIPTALGWRWDLTVVTAASLVSQPEAASTDQCIAPGAEA